MFPATENDEEVRIIAALSVEAGKCAQHSGQTKLIGLRTETSAQSIGTEDRYSVTSEGEQWGTPAVGWRFCLSWSGALTDALTDNRRMG